MKYFVIVIVWVCSILLGNPIEGVAQNHAAPHGHEHGDTCFHVEFSLAHHYLELAVLLAENKVDSSHLLFGGYTSTQCFLEFFRLLSIIQARYPDHHLTETFYDKAINLANKLQNLGASAYLSNQKKKMLLAVHGADYLTKECHCGKCIRHDHED